MIKVFKFFIKMVIALFLITIIATVAIIYFVNPNQFKGTIEDKVLAETEHVLKIQGPISWKLTPMLSLQLDDVILNNKLPFKDKFLSAKTLQANLGLTSLLTGKIFVNLTLQDIDIVLVKNEKGQGNWENFNKQPLAQSNANNSNSNLHTVSDNTATEQNKQNNQHNSLAKNSPQIIVNSVILENGQITYHDISKNLHYQMKQIQISLDNVMQALIGQSEPVNLSMQIVNLNKEALGNLTLDANWALQSQKDSLTIKDFLLTFTFPDGKTTNLKGEATVNSLSQNPNMSGMVAAQDFDFKPWLKDLGIQYNPELPLSANIQSKFTLQSPTLTIADLNIQMKGNGELQGNFKLDTTKLSLQNLTLQGNLTGKMLKWNQIQAEMITAKLNANAGMMNINPIEIQMGDSKQMATVQIDTRSSTPHLTITDQSNEFEIKNLLAKFSINNKIEGKTHFKLDLKASGNNVDQIRQTLSGTAQLEMKDGKFFGVNLVRLLQSLHTNVYTLVSTLSKKPSINVVSSVNSIQELWQKKKQAMNADAFTPFTAIKSNFSIHNGVVTNPDLTIHHPEYMVKGQGSINIASGNTINYHTAVQLLKNPYPADDAIGKYLYSTTLPVSITGSLTDPVVRPDIKSYTNNAIVFAEKNIAKKLIQKQVDKVVNKAVEKAVTNAVVPGAGIVIDKALDENINKAVESTLNSLFEKENKH